MHQVPERPVIYRMGRNESSIIRMVFFQMSLSLLFGLEIEVAKSAFEAY
jgi:hypothetical protein